MASTPAPATEMSPGVGAYVHVPFCARRCAYCSFVVLTARDEEARYLEAVRAEARLRAGEVPGSLRSVYFGGGTPSQVPPEALAALLRELDGAFGIAPGAEVTAEANPDDVTPGLLEAWARSGITRVSLGVQSLVDAELVRLERRHDAGTARAALEAAVSVFPRVSGDLMLAVPEQTADSLRRSLDGILESGVTHVSAYLLEIEKAPRLVALSRERPALFPDDETTARLWEQADDALRTAGLPRYELSSWARPGHEGRHNLRYWKREPVLGLGIAAHTFDGRDRTANTPRMGDYLAAIEAGTRPVTERDRLDPAEATREGVLLGLRLAAGVTRARWVEAWMVTPDDDRRRLDEAFAAGLLEESGDAIRLSRAGVLLSNEVFAAFV